MSSSRVLLCLPPRSSPHRASRRLLVPGSEAHLLEARGQRRVLQGSVEAVAEAQLPQRGLGTGAAGRHADKAGGAPVWRRARGRSVGLRLLGGVRIGGSHLEHVAREVGSQVTEGQAGQAPESHLVILTTKTSMFKIDVQIPFSHIRTGSDRCSFG